MRFSLQKKGASSQGFVGGNEGEGAYHRISLQHRKPLNGHYTQTNSQTVSVEYRDGQACATALFSARTESEAIERALDFAIEHYGKNRMVAEANERFVKSGVQIKDVYEKLDN